ncbi:MAG: hypothetical protein Q8Q25_02025 [bacterium]|nr:hypothetical protein [bacterium]
MIVREVTTAFSYAFRSLYIAIAEKGNPLKYSKQWGIAFGIVVLLGAGFLGYRWYDVSKQQDAHKQFADSIREYDLAMQKGKDWNSIEVLFKSGAQQQKNTTFGPFFLAFQAQALLRQGKKDEALQVMDSIIQTLPSQNPLLPLFKTKRALIRIDMADEQIKNAGIQELTELAHDTKNEQKDMALFYLGFYYWVTDNLSEAKKVWQELVEQYRDVVAPSPWAQRAQSKLDQIVA